MKIRKEKKVVKKIREQKQNNNQTRTYGSESATGQPTIMTEINKNNFQFIWGLFELF